MTKHNMIQHIWRALTSEEQKEVCLSIWTSGDSLSEKIRGKLLGDLAICLRYREKYLRRQSDDRKAAWLYQRVNGAPLRRFHEALLRAWLVVQHGQMIEMFLDKQAIPHVGVFISDEAKTPSKESFCIGLKKIREKWDDRIIALYLGFCIASGAGDFWANLPAALSAEGVDLWDAMVAEHEKQESVIGEQSDSTALSEEAEGFTTLDVILIKNAVATALNQDGALTPDDMEHLVEEVLEASADRQRSFFHQGFFHSLFKKPFIFEFSGNNAERRAWYFYGVLSGLLRAGDTGYCLAMLKKKKGLTKLLTSDTSIPCGAMLLPNLYTVLLDGGEFGLLGEWLTGQLQQMSSVKLGNLLLEMYGDAASLLRKGKSAEANVLLQAMGDALLDRTDLDPDLRENLRLVIVRKKAQAHQLQGNFTVASSMLKEILGGGQFFDAANASADLGLIEGGFRSLAAVLPGKDEATQQARFDALTCGRGCFDDAISKYGDDATNAHFCLGMMGTMSGQEGAEITADHFNRALAGMMLKQEAYTEASLIDWARFGLGLALLETTEPNNLQMARERLQMVMDHSTVFPAWLWVRTLQVATVFDDPELPGILANHLLDTYSAWAFPLLRQAGVHTLQSIRGRYFEWLTSQQMKGTEKFSALLELLGSKSLAGSDGFDEDILDEMEGLAIEDGQVRKRFAEFLSTEGFWEPAWSRSDAEISLAHMYELDGLFDQAADLYRRLFYRLRDSSEMHNLAEARQLAERIHGYNLETDPSKAMLDSLPDVGEDKDEVSAYALLKNGKSVRILYVGGNETQAAYIETIRTSLISRFPGLTLQFYLPGWTSAWNQHFEKIKPMIRQADGVVLSLMVRTQFGRHVRAFCGSEHPWLPCTGKGRQSLEKSIERAAIWYLERQASP